MSFDLRPALLDHLGLLTALHWYFKRYTARTQIQVNFRHTGLERRIPVGSGNGRLSGGAGSSDEHRPPCRRDDGHRSPLGDAALLEIQIEDQGVASNWRRSRPATPPAV